MQGDHGPLAFHLILYQMKAPLLLFPILLAYSSFAQHPGSCQHHKSGALHGTFAKSFAENSRSDTLDILNFTINLDITDFNGQTINGSTRVLFTPKMNDVDRILLDLLQLQVDSVVDADGQMTYQYNDSTLNIALDPPMDVGDTAWLRVYYGGHPQIDPSGFGGFYLTNSIAYNLGVAFESQPHVYGRTWFPCFDNFVERATFEFNITTSAGRNAWCNGALTNEVQSNDTLTRTWVMEQSIPSYLASVAVSNFVAVRDTFPSISGADIPVALVARPNDTTAMKASFANLHAAFDHFEEKFGPYRWNKVGYVLTPNGSMEHSTSIHYAAALSNGNLQYETTMAHELAHQWFGDLITCQTAEEMWINEGWAEYLSFLFLEAVYGYDEYLETVVNNHKTMVHRVHLLDEGHYALSNVPQEWTYGEHSYNKGADVLHSMRAYMGEQDFFEAWELALDHFAFQDVSSEQLRDYLMGQGYDVEDFFEDVILQPGWTAFEIDSMEAVPISGGMEVTLYVQQKLRGANHLYNNVPLDVHFFNADWQEHVEHIVVSGAQSTAVFEIPLEDLALAGLNLSDRLSMAVTGETQVIDGAGNKNFSQANFIITVDDIVDSALVRVDHHWVAPDPIMYNDFAYQLSTDRFWRVQGILPGTFTAGARIIYDGRDLAGSNLDPELMQDLGGVLFHEDSLVLMYRPHQGMDWTPVPNIDINTLGSATDKYGRIEFDGLQVGEYTLAWRKSAVGVAELDDGQPLHVWPNLVRSGETIFGKIGQLEYRQMQNPSLSLVDGLGRIVLEQPMNSASFALQLPELGTGIYYLHLSDGRKWISGSKVFVE